MFALLSVLITLVLIRAERQQGALIHQVKSARKRRKGDLEGGGFQ